MATWNANFTNGRIPRIFWEFIRAIRKFGPFALKVFDFKKAVSHQESRIYFFFASPRLCVK